MKLSIIVALLKLAAAFVGWLERARFKAEGRAEAHAEAKEAHDERVAQANAARADADAIGSVHDDPFNRDRG